jgi:3-oxoacyl-[acyl-carrier-protein] synthase-3
MKGNQQMDNKRLNAGIEYPLPLKIAGLGRYLPERIVSSREFEAEYSLEEGWCERKQGIVERRRINDESIALMAARAAAEAIKDAGLTVADIDLLLNASNSFDCVAPDQSIPIRRELKLANPRAASFSIYCGCLSCLAALDIGSSLLAAGKFQNILVVSALASSPGINREDPIGGSTLGDGAAAMVLTRAGAEEKSALHAARMETYSRAAGVKGFTGKSGRKRLFSKDILTEEFNFEFDSRTMQAEGVKYNKNFIARLLPVDRKAVKLVIPNQSTRIALDMMKLMFSPSKVMGIIDHLGNIGAAGHPMALYEAVKTGRLRRGDLTLLHGMGAGFSIYGVLITY